MNYYRPTHADAADIFRSSPEDRPFIDLSLTHDVAILPIDLRKLNTGVTRWGNLVLGIAIDGAMERGVTPDRIKEALAVGNLVAEVSVTFAHEYLDDDDPAGIGFEGKIETIGDLLSVSGGPMGGEPEATVTFVRQHGMYVPSEAVYSVRDERLPRYVSYTYPLQYGEPAQGNSGDLPEEFIPVMRLGDLEESTTAALEIATFRGDIPTLQP